MSGAFDFTVIIEGKTMREVAQFVSEKLSPMDSVLSTATHFVLKKYKDHGTVMCGKAEDEEDVVTAKPIYQIKSYRISHPESVNFSTL